MVNTEIGMDYATPLGLIINEMIVNTIKYAFPNGEGKFKNWSWKIRKQN